VHRGMIFPSNAGGLAVQGGRFAGGLC
jgi:hypothetical protein